MGTPNGKSIHYNFQRQFQRPGPVKVAVLDDYHRVFDADPAIARLRRRVPVEVFTEKLASLERLRGTPIVIALRERTRFGAAFFDALPGLMASSDAQSMAAVARSTIELTFGLMLAVLRRIPQTDQAMKRGAWPSFAGRTLSGKKLGILGLGRIGREIALLARTFGMQVLAWGPTLTPERAALSAVEFKDLDSLLRERRLRLMRPHAVLINTARGAIIDEAALARVLKERTIAAAGLDVFAEEPLDPDSPLRRLDNAVLTSHLGWPADSTYRTMAEGMVAIIESYLDGSYDKAINPEASHRRRPA